MKTALFLSPHLDDVVFSCGGLLALLADAGWCTVLATVFTRSVMPPQGFALACQLDKGLPSDADYMALRRSEDLRAAALLSTSAVHWLDLPEAPHRGYDTAAALFGPLRADDDVAPALSAALAALVSRFAPDLVLAPQGLGNHVDHQQTTQCILAVAAGLPMAFYRDTPYAIRNPCAQKLTCVPDGAPHRIGLGTALDRKIAAARAYETQVQYQFGGPAALADTLRGFALGEGKGSAAEVIHSRFELPV